MRRLLAGLALTGTLLAAPTPAHGSVLLTNAPGCGNQWCHQHTRTYTYRMDFTVPSWFKPYIRTAAAEWDNRTVLTLVETQSLAANITIRNGQVRAACGQTAVACAHVPYHAPGWNMYGVPPSEGLLPSQKQSYRHLACHELGHSLGLGHGGGGCLRTEARSLIDSELAWLSGANEHPGADDVDLLNRTYPATGH